MLNIMVDLCVNKVMNLDGGGSSVMVVNGLLTGRPSNTKGEREVGDVLLFLPVQSEKNNSLKIKLSLINKGD